jgi:formylglycine-generating enzyme required for sulfatase activity
LEISLPTQDKTFVESSPSPGKLPAEGMVWIPGGTFLMGSDRHYPEEAPAHKVAVNGFWMDRHTVTNADFRRFVEATGYVTLAERPANAADYPGAKPELLEPSAVVFRKTAGPVDLSDPHNWWTYVRGADWRHPQGPGSNLQGLWKHPVVHVAYEDVDAYAKWAGKELPTEAEWEFAARGGLEGAEYVWGDEFTPGGKSMCNNWQGEFPWQNLRSDGYEWTAPVGSFPPNGYGLYEMAGNVWEWTTDWFQDHEKIEHACCTLTDPRGGDAEQSVDPRTPNLRIPRKVMKGGSYLCAPNYCRRYRPAARMAQPIDTAIGHLGFRCIVRAASAS